MKTIRFALICLTIASVFLVSLTASYAKPKKKDERIINTEEGPPPRDPRTPVVTIVPAITSFSTSDGIRFYKMGPYGGYDTPRVSFHMQDKNGLKSYEIKFNEHRVLARGFVEGTTTHRETSMPINIYPHRPGRSGTYALQLLVTNAYDNTVMRSININVDVTEPRVVSFNPGHGQILYADRDTTEIRWAVNATDDFSGVHQVKIMGNMAGVPGTRWTGTDSSPPYHIRVTGVNRGVSDWILEVKDNAGVVNRQSFRITVRPRVKSSPVKNTGSRPSRGKKTNKKTSSGKNSIKPKK